jgi:hypothetical protein
MSTSKPFVSPVFLVVLAAVSATAAPLGWTVDTSGPGAWLLPWFHFLSQRVAGDRSF